MPSRYKIGFISRWLMPKLWGAEEKLLKKEKKVVKKKKKFKEKEKSAGWWLCKRCYELYLRQEFKRQV